MYQLSNSGQFELQTTARKMRGVPGNPFLCSLITADITPFIFHHPRAIILDMADLLHHAHAENFLPVFEGYPDEPLPPAAFASRDPAGKGKRISQPWDANLDPNTLGNRPMKGKGQPAKADVVDANTLTGACKKTHLDRNRGWMANELTLFRHGRSDPQNSCHCCDVHHWRPEAAASMLRP